MYTSFTLTNCNILLSCPSHTHSSATIEQAIYEQTVSTRHKRVEFHTKEVKVDVP
jgi:hypothetical protein